MNRRIRRILWAVDPFEPHVSVQRRTGEALLEIAKMTSASVLPVYMLSPAQLGYSVEANLPLIQEYLPAAQEALQELASSLKISNVIEPVVLFENFSSTSQAVDSLSHYSQKQDIDLIFVGTHGRSGIKRLFLGSFAETLLIRSSIPVVAVGPALRSRYKISEQPQKLIFPTELNELKDKIFVQVIQIAQGLNCELIFFHALPHPVEPFIQTGIGVLGGGWISIDHLLVEQTQRATELAAEWKMKAERQGVKTEVIIQNQATSIVETVLDLAEKNDAALIAMESHTGPVAASLVGSITRQVLRRSPCPVWILKPPPEISKDVRRAA